MNCHLNDEEGNGRMIRKLILGYEYVNWIRIKSIDLNLHVSLPDS